MKKEEKIRKISKSTIVLIILSISIFSNAWGYEEIGNKLVWDSLIFIFIFLAILSWKIDKLIKKIE